METLNSNKTFMIYFASFFTKQKCYVLALFFSSVLLGWCFVAGAYISKVIVDAVVEINQKDFLNCLRNLLTLFVAYQIINNIAWRVSSYIVYNLQLQTKSKIISHLCNNLYKHSSEYFQENFSGKLSDNIRTVVDCTETIIYDLSRLTMSIVLLMLAMLCMYNVHRLFFFTLMIWSFTFAMISTFLSEKIIKLAEDYVHHLSNVFGLISDDIVNIINIKAFSNEKYEIERLGNAQKKMDQSFEKKESTFLKIAFFQGLYTSMLVSAMLCLLIFLRNKNLVTIGDFVLILGLSSQITDHVWSCTEIMYRINGSFGMCNQCIASILSEKDMRNKENISNVAIRNGSISFENVTFRYSDGKNVFQDLSLRIQHCEKIGLVGHSGSGKTTFINLLLRFYEPISGKIHVGEADIREVTQDSLRSCISLVSQDNIMFHRSVLENIRYGNLGANEKDVTQAAIFANAHEFVKDLPNGYNTIIGERGIKLSGGQRQRIAIARAILKNAPILVMDEATSQLDSITEMRLQETMHSLMKGKTVIIAAHRISTIAKMDRIYVFDEGAISHSGTHNHLMKNSNIYRQLCEKLTY
jgi:ATP-binding cassette subfamily B protein